MKNYIKANEWNIIEEGFDPHLNKISESIFSIGNGRMGQRANFEETFSGETLQGNYIAGVYYPDKTRVGWWKNGYPEYFAKVLNAANWIGLEIKIDNEILDLNTCTVTNFKRILNMQEGYLERSFITELASGKQVQVYAKRFYSIVDDEAGALHYSIKALNFAASIQITSFTDGDIQNQDANYDEKFWDEVAKTVSGNTAFLTLQTKKTFFEVCTATQVFIHKNDKPLVVEAASTNREKFVSHQTTVDVVAGDRIVLHKYAVQTSSENHPKDKLQQVSEQLLNKIVAKGFNQMLQEQAAAWAIKWETSDIVIKGDVKAQQAIRFNIFQLNQTYTGKDARLNIGPKGFTGEKYGGSTYWDTEAYCVPFYLSTSAQEVTRNLLIYRYKQLDKAIENAQKLGFTDGAALFPMVTMNGEECHNEWEITFEEIHRNGAIAYAIYNYIRYTGDADYLADYGLEVLIGIARFWKQRVNWSAAKNAYVMLGVTGPNEYENNINNNWYTNTIASWCLKYAIEAAIFVKDNHPHVYQKLVKKLQLDEFAEFSSWNAIIKGMYYPVSTELGVFLQQDGYLDKEQTLVKELAPEHLPLNQKWSWDRILRSCFIKQADVLQGLYFFEDDYDKATLRRNFDFYEPRTVHESSLSPCIHSILAARLGDQERAYQFYLRTARLDLDDYNNDTEDGLHITSMAGTWMSVVEGFAGMRVRDNQLRFNPFLPNSWESFSFTINFRAHVLNVEIGHEQIIINNKSAETITIKVFDKDYTIDAETVIYIDYKEKIVNIVA